MANNFKNTDLVTRLMLKSFMNALQMGAKVDRQLDSQFQKVGATINVRRPIMFTATDGATLAKEDVQERAASVTLDQRKHVAFAITSQDLTLSVEDFTKRYTDPAAAELAQQVETSIGAIYTNIGNFVGTPGSVPDTFLKVGAAAKVLSKLGTPMNIRWSAFYDEDASLALADGLKAVFPSQIATRAIEEASIGKYSKFELFENQSLALHTVGAYAGTPLVNGAAQNVTYAASGDAWTQTIDTDGWDNSVTDLLLAGDVITIAGVNSVNRKTRIDTGDLQTFTVVNDASSGASTGPAELTISPPIITSGSYQTVIVVKTGAAGAQHKQNMAWHENAMLWRLLIYLQTVQVLQELVLIISLSELFASTILQTMRQFIVLIYFTVLRLKTLTLLSELLRKPFMWWPFGVTIFKFNGAKSCQKY